jgi:ketosteroid isomerase-like protein
MLKSVFSPMARLMVMLTLGLSLVSPARAASDQDQIKTVIESQLNAFAIDNGAEALSYAAPLVKQIFQTPEQFMAMVKQGYQPVYRNSNRIFGDVFKDGLGRPAMRVVLTGADGKRYEALYAMEKQADGIWKIAGCVILAIPAQEV